jgi:hypothetical protein
MTKLSLALLLALPLAACGSKDEAETKSAKPERSSPEKSSPEREATAEKPTMGEVNDRLDEATRRV